MYNPYYVHANDQRNDGHAFQHFEVNLVPESQQVVVVL